MCACVVCVGCMFGWLLVELFVELCSCLVVCCTCVVVFTFCHLCKSVYWHMCMRLWCLIAYVDMCRVVCLV